MREADARLDEAKNMLALHGDGSIHPCKRIPVPTTESIEHEMRDVRQSVKLRMHFAPYSPGPADAFGFSLPLPFGESVCASPVVFERIGVGGALLPGELERIFKLLYAEGASAVEPLPYRFADLLHPSAETGDAADDDYDSLPEEGSSFSGASDEESEEYDVDEPSSNSDDMSDELDD